MTVYKHVLGIDGPVYIGTAGTEVTTSGTKLEYANGPTLTLAYETEELDVVAAGLAKAYVNGKVDVGLTCKFSRFQVDGSGAYPSDIAAVMAAFVSGGALGMLIKDTAMGDIKGDFIVTKMGETRDNGKIIAFDTEFKPTFEGTPLVFSARAAS